MQRRIGIWVLMVTIMAMVFAAPAAAQVTGYETPLPFETEVPSEEPTDDVPGVPSEVPLTETPVIPPVVPPTSEVPPPGVPPGDGDAPPPGLPAAEPPTLAMTGLAVSAGLMAAGALVGGGTGLLRLARRRREDDEA